MGRYDSSRTRVAPVFDALMDRDDTGGSWLPALLRSASHADRAPLPEDVGPLLPNHPRWWGKRERRLNPPLSLLEHLVRNVDEAAVQRSRGREAVRVKRGLLAKKDAETIAEALDLLHRGRTTRGWHVLEGRSAPDAFLETDRIVLVVEGKRTERACTTTTTWMKDRSQLLRHMDAASEISNGRPVLGLLVVEGDGAGGFTPSSHWVEQVDMQLSPKMVDRSLPHRAPHEGRTLAQGVLGVVTWQRVCRDFGIAWPPVADA